MFYMNMIVLFFDPSCGTNGSIFQLLTVSLRGCYSKLIYMFSLGSIFTFEAIPGATNAFIWIWDQHKGDTRTWESQYQDKQGT